MTTLKWKGDQLFLGATKMAEVKKHADGVYRYHLGPDDHVSEPYEHKEAGA